LLQWDILTRANGSAVYYGWFAELSDKTVVMATNIDSEFLDAAQTTVADSGDGQLTQLQEQLIATMIENENISLCY